MKKKPKHQIHKKVIVLSLVLLISTYFLSKFSSQEPLEVADAAGGTKYALTELVPSTNWATFYNNNTVKSPDATNDHFGMYVAKVLGENLLLGLSNSRPADTDGALLASVSSAGVLSSVAEFDEQGVGDIEIYNNKAVIPGPDPAYEDGWDSGNVYIYDGTTFTKRRIGSGLANVIHFFNITVDGNTLWGTTGSHDGNYACTAEVLGTGCYGEVVKSVDGGMTWTKQSISANYRTHDIAKLGSAYYSIRNDSFSSGLAKTSDINSARVVTDFPIIPFTGYLRVHSKLFNHNNNLFALSSQKASGKTSSTDAKTLVKIDSAGNKSEIALPFVVGQAYTATGADYSYSNPNQFVSVGDFVYSIGSDGSIYKSNDATLTRWTKILSTGKKLLSISYWPAKNALILGERGLTGKVWMVKL